MAFIKSVEINQFRGIQQLTISDFSNINLIVGDNNSGKTSLLEALQLLYCNAQLTSVRSVIAQRILNFRNDSFYTSFIKTFNINQSKEHLSFSIYAESDNGPLSFEISGNEEIISGEEALQLANMSIRQKMQYDKSTADIPETAKLFTGSIIAKKENKMCQKDVHCTSWDNRIIMGSRLKKKVYYISSFGHLRYDLLQNIVDNLEYKKLVIDILKQFDDSISDICYTKTDDGTYLETVITKNGEIMPFSVYGDGIKKILFILNKIFDAADSILMIDEIETGLHKKYYDMLFPVVFALAQKLNVQLFIATHSIEAIDAILRYGNYDNNNSNIDPIKVITLKKVDTDNGSNIVARNVTGKYVYDNRKVFEFEVRL